MDYADGGDLSNKIVNQKGKLFTENQILDWFTQICLAIKHIHDRKILHRDIKSQNIFLMKNGTVKLGDFGIAKCFNATIEKAQTFIGTPYYLSPEIINNQPYDFKTDIWSLGVLLYEMCSLKIPFDAPNLPQLAIKILNGKSAPLNNIYSKELRNLCEWMMKVKSEERPTIEDILKQKIVKSRIKGFLSNELFNNEFSHTIIHNYNVLKDNNNLAQKNEQNKIQNFNSNNSQSNKDKKYYSKDRDVIISGNMNSNREMNKEIANIKKNLGFDSSKKHHNKEHGSKGNTNQKAVHITRKSNDKSKIQIKKDDVIKRNQSDHKEKDEKEVLGLYTEEGVKKGNSNRNSKKSEHNSYHKKEIIELKKLKKENLKNIQDGNVIWMKGMDNYINNYEKRLEKENQRHLQYSSNNSKNSKKYMIDYDSQKMIYEMDQLQSSQPYVDINAFNYDEYTDDVNKDLSRDNNYYMHSNKKYNDNDLTTEVKNEDSIDDIIKCGVENDIGKDNLIEFSNVIKNFVNDDVLESDINVIEDNIKKELEKKNILHSIIEKTIEKLPDIYYLILNNKI